jgi:response regulator RpfG family c-di-GMP phosphodiesterase
VSNTLRLLIIEDNEDDVWLVLRELQRGGYDVSWLRVETADAMRQALAGQPWDAVISDFSMPQFNLPQALAELKRSGLDLPFIIVSGTIGEESAVAALKAGAHDFLSKGNLTRLVPALEREMREVLVRRERRERERELDAIAGLTRALRGANTRAEMLQIVLEQAMDLAKASSALIAGLDPYTGGLLIEAVAGHAPMSVGQRWPAGEGLLGRVVAGGLPRLSSSQDVAPGPAPGGLHPGGCVPLIAQQHTLGALWVGRQAEITLAELGLLAAFADIAATALHRSALFEQTQERLQRLTALRAIDLAINASLDMRVILDVLLAQVQAQLRVDAACVLLARPVSQTLEFAAGRGFRTPAASRAPVRYGAEPAGAAALERRMIQLTDLDQHRPASPRWAELAVEGFRAYIAVPLVAKGHVNGVLEVFHRQPLEVEEEWLEFLETLAGQAAIAIDNTSLFDGLQRSNAELAHAYDATIEGWSRALDLRDRETEGHTQRVTELTMQLGRRLGMDPAELVHVRRGALLHDIGKMGIPDHILLKPGPLSEEEWVIMRRHPTYAYELLSPISYLRPALVIPLYHHEKWDGSGYPHGLRGTEIPLAARAFAVADVWDALQSHRPYRPGWAKDKIRDYIQQQSGSHFDPDVVAIALDVIAESEQPPP